MSSALHRAFDDLTVIVTGHTGLKGSWLSIWPWGYRETDVLGGRDPYPASKAMAGLTIDACRQAGGSVGMYATCAEQLAAYSRRAREQGQPWTH